MKRAGATIRETVDARKNRYGKGDLARVDLGSSDDLALLVIRKRNAMSRGLQYFNLKWSKTKDQHFLATPMIIKKVA